MPQYGYCSAHCETGFKSHGHGVTGKALWAELSLLNNTECMELLKGVADEWVEHKQFMPSLEMCAAKVSSPKLQELSIQKMPKKFGDVHDEGMVMKLEQNNHTVLPKILGGRDGCQGDSGGPLWRWEENSSGKKKAVQLGLISRGQKCARINRPGIYTNISAFKNWIVENTRDGGCSKFI